MPGRYLTPLPAVLAVTLEAAVNRVLAMDQDSARRLFQLDGRLVELQLHGLDITLFFAFSHQRVAVRLDAEREADTVIAGTPVALFAMALPDSGDHWGTVGSRVRISGDATLARDLERLFSRLDPDWEGQLTNWFGEVLGHQMAERGRGAAGAMQQTMTTLEGMASEFLQRPASPLALPEELRQFGRAVDALRDATARLEARLRTIDERRAVAAGNKQRGEAS
jgi:ubiquinone biosynthesis protein UbiJ